MWIDRVCHGPGIAEHFAKVSSSLRTMLSALTLGILVGLLGRREPMNSSLVWSRASGSSWYVILGHC